MSSSKVARPSRRAGRTPALEFLEWLLLRRVINGGLVKVGSAYLADGRPAVAEPIEELTAAGLLALAAPDPAVQATRPVVLTAAGIIRYRQLAERYEIEPAAAWQPDDRDDGDGSDDGRSVGYVMTSDCPHPIPGGPAWHVGPCGYCEPN